jgi:DNA polymerase elongation subunit (family B)
MTRQRYVAGWYDYREKCVCLKPEGTDEIVEFPFPHYFYLEGRPSEQLMEKFSEVEMVGKWCRCYSPASSANRKALTQELESVGVQTFEADVSPINRFLTDNNIGFGDLRVLYYDLETDGSPGWDKLGEHRILMIGYHSSVTGETGHILAGRRSSGECAALVEFERLMTGHDLLVAWNGDAYDEPVLKARFEEHGLGDMWSEHWRKVNFLDLMRLFKKYYARDDQNSGVRVSFALDNVAKAVLGYGKAKKPMLTEDGKNNPVQAIVETWAQRPEELAEYCERDVEIMVELEKKFGFIAFHKTLSNLCGRFLSSYTIWAGYLNDAFVLRWGQKNERHFRTKYTFYDERLDVEKIEGAYVMDPVVGMHDGVCDLDFASLYPNVIRSFNISPEVKALTKNERKGPLAFNGVRFSPTQKGAFPQIVAETLDLRKKHKKRVAELEEQGKEGSLEHLRAKQMSDAYKLLGNTMYGIMSSPMLRYYDPECGEAVTSSARACIQHVMKEAATKKIPVLYGDTDSCFLRCTREEALAFSKKMEESLDRFIEERGGTPGLVRLDLDVVYSRIIFVTKKRYCGMKDTGKLDVKGLEFIRSDNCKAARDMQLRLIEYLLGVERPMVSMASKLVERFRTKCYSGGLELEAVAMAQSLSRKLDAYKANPPHVRIAKEMMAKGQEVYEGMKIPYFITGSVKGQQVVKHASEFAGQYDADFYWTKKIYPPTQAVLEAAFPGKVERDLLAYLSPKKPKKPKAKKGAA